MQRYLNFSQELGCIRCGCTEHYDETGQPQGKVTWICCYCGGLVCRYCALVDFVSKTYYDDTYCSEDCRERKETEREIPKIMES